MKKTLLLLFVCVVSTHVIAQKTKAQKAETPNQSALSVNDVAPPPPLPPPPPAAPTPAPPPPPPPAPPVPPPPPPAPEEISEVKFNLPVIVNDKGYLISVHYNNGNNMVYMKKKGVTEKVSLAKWNANAAFYENKYGMLPPPPPPPPAPPAPLAPPARASK